ncbi:MAG TPA: hypothetical protein DD473_22005 [Planctomycetaceae bacterium]|nr:hypothetical protein [Planctomycetaceae bacterium]|tara:strand:+ start:60 stop:368 length:309 start_codon:yes stop_codon:yes gene_type:complete
MQIDLMFTWKIKEEDFQRAKDLSLVNDIDYKEYTKRFKFLKRTCGRSLVYVNTTPDEVWSRLKASGSPITSIALSRIYLEIGIENMQKNHQCTSEYTIRWIS